MAEQSRSSALTLRLKLDDKVLSDSIPALYFLPEQYSVEGLVQCVKQVVDLFHPCLILGVSDEIPPDGVIERVQLAGDLVQELVWQYPLVTTEKIIRFQPDRDLTES